LEPKELPDSAGKLQTVTRWNADGYPDLLVVSTDGSHITVYLNQIVWARNQMRREKVANPTEHIFFPEWESRVIYSTKSAITDYIQTDINDDGIEDLILVVETDRRGVAHFAMLVADNASKTRFHITEIEGDNASISKILGFFDYNADGKKDFVFVNKHKQLCVLLNRDPIYETQVIWDKTVSNLSKFWLADMNNDGLVDFIFFESGKLEILWNTPSMDTVEIAKANDVQMFATEAGIPYNFAISYKDEVYWIS
jgi:hypothetical protein